MDIDSEITKDELELKERKIEQEELVAKRNGEPTAQFRKCREMLGEEILKEVDDEPLPGDG